MGRRRGGGVKSPSTNDRILRRHIEAAGTNYSTVEQLVEHLRSTYPHYSRHKLRPFTKHVERVIMVSNSRNDAVDDSEDDGSTPIVKKRRKVEEDEEKLQRIEAEHMRRRNGKVSNNGGGGSSSSLATASSSDDAIYGEKFEPEFDLINSLMRDNLRRKSTNSGEERAGKEAMELEVVDNKGVKDLNLMNEKPKLGDNLNLKKNDKSGRGGNETNRITFKDLGGMSGVIKKLKRKVIVPFYHPQVPRHLGVKPTVGILLHGAPGCGKTTLAHAIANETGVPFYKISATELVSGVSGASEENIRELFSKAYRTAPSIVFIDEIDSIASKRENLQREMEKRIVTQLMTCMDELHTLARYGGGDAASGYVLVIAATNRPDSVDPALRRPGRFDLEIALGVPDELARVQILSVLISNLKVEGDFDLLKIARSTPGFVGADLTELADNAGNLAMDRIIDKREIEMSKEQKDGQHCEDSCKQPWSDEEMENLIITMADFEEAAKIVQPSLRREGFSAIPDVKWDNVGGLHFLREEFNHYIVRHIKFPEEYKEFGLAMKTGFLLYGPPGCGKTLIAKAVANEAGANFIHIMGPELLNKYVGESELAVRTIFSRARTCSPCILFFDEVDALTTERGKEGGWVVQRLVNQLLIELDGAEQRHGVYVIGATNRPEVMDRALLRPGRFGNLLYVPLPSPDERGMILKALALAEGKPIDASVDLVALGKDSRFDNLSGADLSALLNKAASLAIRDKRASTDRSCSTIRGAHFTKALENIFPSVSDKQIQYYKLLSESFKVE